MWLIVNLLIGAAFVALLWWLRSRDIKLTWYEWLMGLLGFILAIFAFQNFFASLSEYEPDAAPIFLLVFLIPAVILIAIAAQLAIRHHRETG